MLCRNCGTEIADKAIVCYRCGTATTEPARKPVAIRRRRSPVLPIVILLALLFLALVLARHYGLIASILIDFPAVHA
jgi:hypothetical protein